MGTARLVGMNHVALEVGDLAAALELYGSLFAFRLRGRSPRMAFIDMGDQFIALSEGRTQAPDAHRHVGLVVDDKEAVRAAAVAAGLRVDGVAGGGLDVHDPWGNHLQFVNYQEIQFERTDAVKRALGIGDVQKTAAARAELRDRGLGG